MTFTVVYRADGVRKSEVIEAADRSACFAELKRRGIRAVSVTEGVPKVVRKPVSSSLAKGGAAGALIVLAAVIAWLFLSSDAPKKAVGDEPKAREIANAATNQTKKLIKKNRRPKSVQKLTASIGALPDKPIFEKPARVYGEINGTNLFPRPLFKTREENHIAGLVNAKPGSRCLLKGFHPGEKERYLAALDVPVEPDPNDTPEEAEMRKYMTDLKKELKERVANGEDILDIVQEARDNLNELANMRDKIAQKFNMLQKEGTVEEIMTYYEEANGILAEYGMGPLALRSNKKELYKTYLERKRQAAAEEGLKQADVPKAEDGQSE